MQNKQHVVVVVDCDHPSIDPEKTVLKDICPEVRWNHCRTEDEIIAQCAEGEALLVQYAPMTRRVLEKLPRCKVIARYGVGVDTIDLKASEDLGIIVSNDPDSGTNEVSDHALAMMLCLTRKVPQANAYVKNGQWDFRLMAPVRRHKTQTIGIIGIGRIGQAMAHKTHAIGMRVLAYDPHVDPASLPDYITLVSLEDLLRQADVVSIHCPLTSETRNMLDEKKLRLLKPSAYLVNTARGNIVNEADLDKLLTEKKLAGAAMDVLAVEPAVAAHPLFKHDNFYCTPHIAWHSEESEVELKRKAAEEARRVLLGEAPQYQVNKF